MTDKIRYKGKLPFTMSSFPAQLFKTERERSAKRLKMIEGFFKQVGTETTIDKKEALDLIRLAESAVSYDVLDNYEELPQTFKELFKIPSDYNKVLSLMIKHKWARWISSGEHKWLKTGSGNKKTFIWLLRILEKKGYFKEKLTSASVIIVAENSFSLSVKIDTVNRVKHNSLHTQECPFYDSL